MKCLYFFLIFYVLNDIAIMDYFYSFFHIILNIICMYNLEESKIDVDANYEWIDIQDGFVNYLGEFKS